MENVVLFSVLKLSPNTQKVLTVFGEYADRIYAYMENMQRASLRIILLRQET
jgi:hypothetical protein